MRIVPRLEKSSLLAVVGFATSPRCQAACTPQKAARILETDHKRVMPEANDGANEKFESASPFKSNRSEVKVPYTFKEVSSNAMFVSKLGN